MYFAATGGYDHSYQTEAGHFLQMASIGTGPGAHKMANLQLPPITYLAAGEYCFQLYYIRFGGDIISSLTIYVSIAMITLFIIVYTTCLFLESGAVYT